MLNIIMDFSKEFTLEEAPTLLINPNFSIVIPINCRCACSFCFQNKICEIRPDYYELLEENLSNLPSNFEQISITGGEPTLFSGLNKVLGIIKKYPQFKKVVLTTNGINPGFVELENFNVINHVNVSRHHYNDRFNRDVFGNKKIPSTANLARLIRRINKKGKPVTLSCVLYYIQEKCDVLNYIHFAKYVGATNIFFRKIQEYGNDLEPTLVEREFRNCYGINYEGFCPVCRTTIQYIEGMEVSWKASVLEPSNDFKLIYELIYQPDGNITSDWSGKNEWFPVNKKLYRLIKK
jgi:MoaA/NifB/PqqE/SkfB family radical SAM enzyme